VINLFQMTDTGRLEAIVTTLVDPWVEVDGTALLDGTLDLYEYNQFWLNPPVLSQIIPLISGGTIVGRFAQVLRPALLQGLMVCPRYQTTAVDLPVRRAGDLNEDSFVNIDDLLMIVHGWGVCPLEPATCDANADCDTDVTIDDLLIVINNWSSP
jgi:hypothetical protein